MKILFIVPYVPNLIRVRPYNLIRSLSARGHQITLFTVWSNEQERLDIDDLKQYCQEVHAVHLPKSLSLLNCVRAIPTRDPFQSVFSWQPSLLDHLNGHPYDVVHVEHLRGARYGLYLKKHTNLPVVWDSVDCISHLFRQASAQSKDLLRRWRSRIDLNRTERYEGWLMRQFDHVLVTSSIDKAQLLAIDDNPDKPSTPVSVVSNGVDLEYFYWDKGAPKEEATVIVSGKMSYHANISMTLNLAKHIMPLVWREKPEVKLMVVGKDPTREIRALEQHPAISVTGTVPDLPPYLQKATIAVAPVTYNAGIQNKMLEAMACGTPVITAPQAIAGLDLTPGQEVVVAHDPNSYAQAILELLQYPEERQQIAKAGYSYVQEQHNWANIVENLEGIYNKTAAQMCDLKTKS